MHHPRRPSRLFLSRLPHTGGAKLNSFAPLSEIFSENAFPNSMPYNHLRNGGQKTQKQNPLNPEK
jgi:hypothetical protein